MIKLLSSLKNIFSSDQDKLAINNPKLVPIEQKQDTKTNINISDKVSSLFNSLNSKTKLLVEEFKTIQEKCKDLPKTNYDLGMKYLESGNLAEAIFRFKVIKKFWPNYYDAYYQLTYCLIIDGKFKEAELVIIDLLSKNPEYTSKIKELFDIVEKELSQEM